MKKIKVSWTRYWQSMACTHVHGFFWASLSFPSLASRDSWQWDAGLFVLLMWFSSTLTKWTRAIPTALNLDCFASTQFTWKALALLHTFSTHSFKWFSVLSIERRGKDNNPVKILERTEYNLGVQLTLKIFKAMFCCSLLQLQDSGPRQRFSKAVRLESLFLSALHIQVCLFICILLIALHVCRDRCESNTCFYSFSTISSH